jgi:hypothetical protein
VTSLKTRPANWLVSLSLGLTVAAAIYLLVWPVYSGFQDNQPARATLVAINGLYAIIPVMFPVFVALLPLMVRKQAVRVVAAILIGGFSLVALSIGLFYLPAAILMVLAACVADTGELAETPSR